MWLTLAIFSALLLGVYDVAKKGALKHNGVLWILFTSTVLATLFLCPFLSHGSISDHLCLVFKAFLVSTSWVTGMLALKMLPITTVSTFKASRPVFVLLFSILIYGEKLNAWQWAGSLLSILAIWMLSLSSKREGISFTRSRGVLYMSLAVFSGVASALWDKHIMGFLEPLFVQSWTNLYISLLLGICLLIQKARGEFSPLKWDWTLPLIAVIITGADYLYFKALHEPGAMISVISLIRRASVIITFALGAILFKERNLRSKSVSLGVMLLGMILIVIGTA